MSALEIHSGPALVNAGYRLTATGLAVERQLTFGEWEELGSGLGQMEKAVQWWIGDWLNYGERTYGEKYTQAMDATDVPYGVLANYAWVASRVSLRNEKLSWTHHLEVASLDDSEQAVWLNRAVQCGFTSRELRTAIRQSKRREALPVAPPTGEYQLIYADPPWEYEFAESDTRELENHYDTMSLEAIQSLPVPASDDAMLFLWATSPKLHEAMSVVDAWGFTYRTSMVWVKDRIGMGYYARQQHELLLIAKRGDLPVPEPADRPSSVLSAPRGVHSRKPHEAYDLIDRMYPGLTKIELFARNTRDGWASWGADAEVAA